MVSFKARVRLHSALAMRTRTSFVLLSFGHSDNEMKLKSKNEINVPDRCSRTTTFREPACLVKTRSLIASPKLRA
jgi:hypothetical protein